jgi:hypothetical protein
MKLLYNIQAKFYEIIDYFTYRRCKNCGEITIDRECDFCNIF